MNPFNLYAYLPEFLDCFSPNID